MPRPKSGNLGCPVPPTDPQKPEPADKADPEEEKKPIWIEIVLPQHVAALFDDSPYQPLSDR